MPALTADIRLIVGLGNPGADYVDTRHNAGFWLIDLIAADQDASFRFEKRYNADECKFKVAGKDVFLLKPMTFMNRLAESVDCRLNLGLCRYPPACRCRYAGTPDLFQSL